MFVVCRQVLGELLLSGLSYGRTIRVLAVYIDGMVASRSSIDVAFDLLCCLHLQTLIALQTATAWGLELFILAVGNQIRVVQNLEH